MHPQKKLEFRAALARRVRLLSAT